MPRKGIIQVHVSDYLMNKITDMAATEVRSISNMAMCLIEDGITKREIERIKRDNLVKDGVTKYCSICREIQYNTPSGVTCKNDHGGAESITEL